MWRSLMIIFKKFGFQRSVSKRLNLTGFSPFSISQYKITVIRFKIGERAGRWTFRQIQAPYWLMLHFLVKEL